MFTSEDKLVSSAGVGGVSTLQLQFAYNQWANELILSKMAELSEAELTAPGQTDHDSVFQLLLHTIDTEWSWRIVCQGGPLTSLLWEVESLPDLASIARFWQKEHEQMRAFLHSLKDADLAQEIDFGTLQGNNPQSASLLYLLIHILSHSNAHRAEFASYLTKCGHSPGNMSFLDYTYRAGR